MSHYQPDEEFSQRIKHNFREYVLLTSSCNKWTEGDVLAMIYRLPGYKSHKTVRYGEIASHIHIKFEDEYLAEKAVRSLNKMNCRLIAVLVDDVLKALFTCERDISGKIDTEAIVDITGNPPRDVNFLADSILNSIFQDFGSPLLTTCKISLKEPHVVVKFHSMAEAFAACIFFGEWCRFEVKTDCFFFRIRLNPSNKQDFLIRNCGGEPIKAFKLDYFLQYEDLKPSGFSVSDSVIPTVNSENGDIVSVLQQTASRTVPHCIIT